MSKEFCDFFEVNSRLLQNVHMKTLESETPLNAPHSQVPMNFALPIPGAQAPILKPYSIFSKENFVFAKNDQKFSPFMFIKPQDI